MTDVLRVGDVLGRYVDDGASGDYDGFCGGEFGRDSYDLKRVEHIGADYVITRTAQGAVAIFTGHPSDLVEYVLPPEAWDGQ